MRFSTSGFFHQSVSPKWGGGFTEGPGFQPIWEVATDRVNGGACTSTYIGGCNTDRVNGGAGLQTI